MKSGRRRRIPQKGEKTTGLGREVRGGEGEETAGGERGGSWHWAD